MRAIVYVCVHWCGGLGDRLNGLMGTYDTSRKTSRDFYVHAPTTFGYDFIGAKWTKSIPSECASAIAHPHSFIDKHPKNVLHLAQGSIPCVAVRTNVNYLSWLERKAVLKMLFASIAIKKNYSAVHLRTGGNGDYKGLDSPRDTVENGLALRNSLPTDRPINIVSDSVSAKKELARGCDVCTFDKRPGRHVDRQRVSKKDVEFVWKEFFILAGATCIAHSRSGFSEIAVIWPGSPFSASCSSHYVNGTLRHY